MTELITLKPFYLTKNQLVKSFLEKRATDEQYKRVGIQLSNGDCHDFGHWMYTSVEILNRGTLGPEYKVKASSFEFSRYIFVNGIISIINRRNIGDIYLKTLLQETQFFFIWLQKSNTPAPNSVDEARDVYRTYTIYLLGIVKSHNPLKKQEGIFGQQSAHKKQIGAKNILSEAFDVDEKNIVGFTKNIRKRGRKNSSFVGYNDEERNNALSYYYQFFEQVSQFLLDKKEYPHRIKLMGESAILKTHRTSHNVLTENMENSKYHIFRYFDFENGFLLDENNVLKRLEKESGWLERTRRYRRETLQDTLNTMQNLRNSFKSANIDYLNDPNRLSLGLRAMKAYFMILLDVTGMNDSTLSTIKWSSDDFTSEASSHKFRNIKRRAGNKEVVFELQSIFIKSFRIFIKLRRFVLNGYDCEYLFFINYGKKSIVSKNQIRGAFAKECYASHKTLYSKLSFFGSRSHRKLKNRWLMKRTNGNIYLSSAMLQHEPHTNLKDYPSSTEEEKLVSMGNYLQFMQDKVKNDVSYGKPTSVGECISLNDDPVSDSDTDYIKPDCSNPMTCLFCIFYRIIPDEDNIWKLISLEYVIKEVTIVNARSKEHFNKVMGPILERINTLLEVILKKEKNLKNKMIKIRKNVYLSQNLHWYWDKRLELLWKLGVV